MIPDNQINPQLSQVSRFESSLLITLAACYFLALFLPLTIAVWFTAGFPIALVLSIVTGSRSALNLSLFMTLATGLMIIVPVDLSVVPLSLALAIYWLLVLSIRQLRDLGGWFRLGAISSRDLVIIVSIAIVSGIALLLWYLLFSPDVSEFKEMVVDLPLWALVIVGLGFSAANAAAEEIVFRGLLMHVLDGAFGKTLWTLIAQAVAFGAFHLHGFPSGTEGMVLAGIYGLMLGILRRRSGGILAPWLTHVLADVVIFTILVVIVPAGG